MSLLDLNLLNIELKLGYRAPLENSRTTVATDTRTRDTVHLSCVCGASYLVPTHYLGRKAQCCGKGGCQRVGYIVVKNKQYA